MKKLISVAFATVLASTGSAAFAEQEIQKQAPIGPVAMTDAQLDNVAAGLITVVDLVDITNVANNNRVAIPVNAAAVVQVGILSNQAGLARAMQALNQR